MRPVDHHAHLPKRRFDGGDLDCGNGLLLQIRQNLDLLDEGELLEILSNEISVEEDLPAWCRLTNNELLSWTHIGRQRSYLICRGNFVQDRGILGEKVKDSSENRNENKRMNENKLRDQDKTTDELASLLENAKVRDQQILSAQDRMLQSVPAPIKKSQSILAQIRERRPSSLPAEEKLIVNSPSNTNTAAMIQPLSVMSIGSWPRPAWLMPYMHKHLEGRISDDEFDTVADDAVRLAVQAQTKAGVSVITDGEQRRDNYASFVGQRLSGCQLIPITDLLPLVDDPDKFKKELKSLDVPADRVRHPAVMAKLFRKGTVTGNELSFLKSISSFPAKIALPGPYLLSRMMWMDCITDKAYATRKELALDLVRILQEEISELLSAGASLIQLDEPVLSEVVFSGAKKTHSFMCGALSERGGSEEELSFATDLINATCAGFPQSQLALHVCRGNWTPDESAALSGGYEALLPVFNSLTVGTLFLEYCTPRAGDVSVLKGLRQDLRVGLGVVNPKSREIESIESIMQKANSCIELIGPERVLLNPDCGFATFADNPVSSSQTAEHKLAAVVQAAKLLKEQHGLDACSIH